jgi:branched-chain amino acid transport system ATP-binding protein
MSIILTCIGLAKTYGEEMVVRGVDLDVRKGHIHSVIGPNGAGKSTFFNLISGQVSKTAGTVFFKGEEITDHTPNMLPHIGISRCFQRTNVFPKLTIYENVWGGVFACANEGPLDFLRRPLDRGEIKDKTEEIVASVGLSHKLHDKAETLSHGQSRMLEVAVTLAAEPELVLLDEPTQGLAPEATQEMTELVKTLAGTYTILLIEHKMHIVMEISDVISVLNLGQKIAEGKPADIQNNQLVQDAYLGRLRDNND